MASYLRNDPLIVYTKIHLLSTLFNYPSNVILIAHIFQLAKCRSWGHLRSIFFIFTQRNQLNKVSYYFFSNFKYLFSAILFYKKYHACSKSAILKISKGTFPTLISIFLRNFVILAQKMTQIELLDLQGSRPHQHHSQRGNSKNSFSRQFYISPNNMGLKIQS